MIQKFGFSINNTVEVLIIFLFSSAAMHGLLLPQDIFSQEFLTEDEIGSPLDYNTTFKLLEQRNMSEDYTNFLPDLFEKVEKSVVQITESGSAHKTESDPSRLGSGFVYDELGHIVTNFHVVDGTKNNIAYITFLDGVSYEGEVIGTDPYSDLAVLKLVKIDNNISSKLVPLDLGNSSSIRIGQKVVAVGNPFGLSGSLTEGIISGLGRLMPAGDSDPFPNDSLEKNLLNQFPSFSIPDIIQTDAAINPGNSGGPLLDMSGKVIGINTAIFSNTGVYSGIGFAIPSNFLTKIIPELIKNGYYEHPYVGVNGFDITPEIANLLKLPEAVGFLVVNVTENSPANKAGIQGGNETYTINGLPVRLGGDIITNIDQKNVRKVDDILSYLENYKQIGENVNLTILRGPDLESKEINITLNSRPMINSNVNIPSLGVLGLDITPELSSLMNLTRDNGFLIASIIDNSSASIANLRGGYTVTEMNGTMIDLGGDTIVKMDNIDIKNQIDIKDYIKTKKVGDTVIITIIRDGQYLTKSLILYPISEQQIQLVKNKSLNNNDSPKLQTPQEYIKEFLESCKLILSEKTCESMIIIR